MLVPLFQDRNHDFFGGAGVGGAFEHHQLTGAQVRRDGLGGVRDVAEVGFVILIQRRRDADDDGVHLGQAGIVRGGFEALGAGLLNFAGQDADDVGAALGQSRDLALINIEAGDPELLLGIQQGQGQTDVAEADNGDSRLTSFNLGL